MSQSSDHESLVDWQMERISESSEHNSLSFVSMTPVMQQMEHDKFNHINEQMCLTSQFMVDRIARLRTDLKAKQTPSKPLPPKAAEQLKPEPPKQMASKTTKQLSPKPEPTKLEPIKVPKQRTTPRKKLEFDLS